MYRTIGTRGWAFLAAFSLAMPAVAQIQPIAIPARDFGPVWTGFYVGAAFGAGWAALARAGVLANPTTLLYVAGGYAGQNVHTDGFASGGGGASASFSNDQTVNGWTLGPGFETMFGRNWSGKLEYRYSQFGRTTLAGTNIGLTPSNHAIRAGISYRFGGLGVASSDEPTPPGPTNVRWTGIYGGVAGGGGMGFGRVNAAAGGASTGFDSGGQGLLGGFFGGADYQFSPYALVGVMGDFTWTGLQSTLSINAPGGGSAYLSADANRQWSVMGRVGYLPVPATLLYAAGGFTQLNVHATASAVLPGGAMPFASSDTTFNGFTVGPGI